MCAPKKFKVNCLEGETRCREISVYISDLFFHDETPVIRLHQRVTKSSTFHFFYIQLSVRKKWNVLLFVTLVGIFRGLTKLGASGAAFRRRHSWMRGAVVGTQSLTIIFSPGKITRAPPLTGRRVASLRSESHNCRRSLAARTSPSLISPPRWLLLCFVVPRLKRPPPPSPHPWIASTCTALQSGIPIFPAFFRGRFICPSPFFFSLRSQHGAL